jgi:hypothetical protein
MATSNNTARNIVTLKGRGKAARLAAYGDIAPAAMAEQVSRVALIATLQAALGKTPSADETKAARREYQIGRVAARLTSLPKGKDALSYATDLVLHYAAPPAEGKATRPLRAGQLGRRTVAEQRLVRAADEAWSQVAAELGTGNAKTQKERNKAKRNAAPASGMGKKGAAIAPTHEQLVTPAKPLTRKDACAYVDTQAATLLAFANKNAKLLPTSYGEAVQAFKRAINKAMNDAALAETIDKQVKQAA